MFNFVLHGLTNAQKRRVKTSECVIICFRTKTKGITDENVLKAIAKVPRHLYLDSSFEAHAYQDKAFPIGANQTISQPFTVATQTALLR